MKVPLALLNRLAELDQRITDAAAELDLAEAVREECRRAIELIEAAPETASDEAGLDAAAAAMFQPGTRRTRAAVLAAIEDAVCAAGEGGTTLEQIARRTGMKRSRLDPHVVRLVEAEKCVVEGDQIMLNRNPKKSLFPETAK